MVRYCVGKKSDFSPKNDNYTAIHNQNYPNPLNQVRKIWWWYFQLPVVTRITGNNRFFYQNDNYTVIHNKNHLNPLNQVRKIRWWYFQLPVETRITGNNRFFLPKSSIGSFQTLFPKKTKVRPIKKVWWYSYWASKISPKYRIWGRRCLRRRRKSIKTTKTFPLRQKCQNVKIFKNFFYHQINHTNTLISTWIRWKILINSRVIENVRFLEFSW